MLFVGETASELSHRLSFVSVALQHMPLLRTLILFTVTVMYWQVFKTKLYSMWFKLGHQREMNRSSIAYICLILYVISKSTLCFNAVRCAINRLLQQEERFVFPEGFAFLN